MCLATGHKPVSLGFEPRIEPRISLRERGGEVVEHRTLNREVLGLIPTNGTVLCP